MLIITFGLATPYRATKNTQLRDGLVDKKRVLVAVHFSSIARLCNKE